MIDLDDLESSSPKEKRATKDRSCMSNQEARRSRKELSEGYRFQQLCKTSSAKFLETSEIVKEVTKQADKTLSRMPASLAAALKPMMH